MNINKKSVRDLDLNGKKVVMRVDFNVPLDNGTITDDTRVQAALPTIRYVLEQGGALVLMSHLGRPKGKDPSLSLAPVAEHLGKQLGQPVAMAPDCRGAQVQQMAHDLKPGEVLMLENTRFYPEEEGKVKADDMSEAEKAEAKKGMKEKQKAMARELAALGNVYVNDAFGAAHRSHASTAVIAEFIEETAAGLLMEKELQFLGKALDKKSIERPFVAIIGGAKISGKLEVLHSLIEKVDTILIGGGMSYTFVKAQGGKIGNSLCEDDLMETARKTMAYAEEKNVRLQLPLDTKIADDFSGDANTDIVSAGQIPDGWEGLDIGPETISLYNSIIKDAKMVVWNGPMGVFEIDCFAVGTTAVAEAVAASGAVSIIGGGDSVSAVNKCGLAAKMSHISTGGGASLELLEGKELPGVAVIADR